MKIVRAIIAGLVLIAVLGVVFLLIFIAMISTQFNYP